MKKVELHIGRIVAEIPISTYIHRSSNVYTVLSSINCASNTQDPRIYLTPSHYHPKAINVEDHQHHISENQHIPKLISKVYKKKSTDKRLIPCSNDRQHKAPYPAVSAHRSSKFIQRAYPFSQIITDLFAKHQCGILPPHPSHLLATSHENM